MKAKGSGRRGGWMAGGGAVQVRETVWCVVRPADRTVLLAEATAAWTRAVLSAAEPEPGWERGGQSLSQKDSRTQRARSG